MTKARILTAAGLIHLTVAALLSLTFLFGQPSTAVGSGMGFTPTPTSTPSPKTKTPPPVCKLEITKTADPTEMLPGDLVTFVVQVCNVGNKTCEDVVVSDDLPDELEVVSVSTSQGQAVVVGNDVRAEFGDLIPGACAELTIVARLRDDVDLCTQFTNVATIGDDVVSNLVTLTVPCLPESGESGVRNEDVATQAVLVGLLVMGVGLLATGLALRVRTRA